MPDDGHHPVGNGEAGELRPTSLLGHRVMFVLLTAAAFVLFAPTILLPVLREHCALLAEESRLARSVGDLEREIDRRTQLADAFAHDVVINERLAILDLRYAKPNEVVLPVLHPTDAGPVPAPRAERSSNRALDLPAGWPPAAHRFERWASELGLIGLFLDPTLRPAFLLMAAGLVISAFVLFAPKSGLGRPTVERPPHAESCTAPQSAV